jgi:hypothetical protein
MYMQATTLQNYKEIKEKWFRNRPNKRGAEVR